MVSAVEPLHTAGVWKRVGNLVIDEIGIILSYVAILILFWVLASAIPVLTPILSPIEVVLSSLAWFGLPYYVFFESIWQRTPGKWITGTKVVKLDGTKASFWNIVGRTLCRYIPFELFSFHGTHPYGWHDRISGTMVVPAVYTPAQAAVVNPKDRGKNLLVLLLILGFCLLIPLIGIMASIVLVSLNSARIKGANTEVISYVNMARNAAEADVPAGDYSGTCNDQSVVDDLNSAQQASLSTSTPACAADATSYILAAPLRDGGYYCVDGTGSSATIADLNGTGLDCSGYTPLQATN